MELCRINQKTMIRYLLETDATWVGFVLRLTLGIVLLPHALQKLFGWFNGPGLSGEYRFMTEQAGIPGLLAIFAIIVECSGTFMLLAGFATKLTAFLLFVQFWAIIFIVHAKNGFFMNWFAKLPAGQEGFEFHLLVLGICIALMITGGGEWSVDEWLGGRWGN